jgi:NADH dehydrogenase
MAGQPRVVIIGAGFGGFWEIRELTKAPVDVVLVDRNNYHTFFPLLYQVGAAELGPEQISHPVRSFLRRRPNVEFLMDEVKKVDMVHRVVEGNRHSLNYDYLVLAAGSASHFFGVSGAADNSLPLRSLEEGIEVRNHILHCFEQAAHEPDPAVCQRLLTFTIVGGGPTGVEFSGALSELISGPMWKDYPTLDFQMVQIVLLEAGNGLLSGMPQKLSQYALDRLHQKGVKVRLEALADEVTGQSVRLKSGELISTETVIWTAGVRASGVAESLGLPVNNKGQVSVGPTLQIPEHPEVYVVGDSASLEANDGPLPMIAPVAMQQGEAAARNIVRQVKGQEPHPFRYKDMGMLAVIGRNAAVAHLGRVKFTGFLAWVLWLVVHIYRLIGFRNRLQVLTDWGLAYFSRDRAIRFILPSHREERSLRENNLASSTRRQP